MLNIDYYMDIPSSGYETTYYCEENFVFTGLLHCHDFYEFYLHYNGGEHYTVNNRVYPLCPNQLMLLPPFCVHGRVPGTMRSTYERSVLYVSVNMLQKLSAFGQVDFLSIFERLASENRYQFIIPIQEAAQCRKLLQRMVSRGMSTDPLDTAQDYADMLSFLCIITRQMGKAENDIQPVPFSDMIRDVLSYINTHFTESLTLEGIATQFHLSPSYLSHVFLEHTGRSVYNYILYRRIMLAKELLHSNLPLNTISNQCGFNDYSNFLRIFKKIEKSTPTAYRKKHMKERVPGDPDKFRPEALRR